MYVRKSYNLGQVIQRELYYPGNFGAPGKPRTKKKEPTPEDVSRQNQKNKEKHIQRLIIANFKGRDYWLTLTYDRDKHPDDFKDAEKTVRHFIANMRYACRKAGATFKWILVTEMGSRGAVHHHFVIEDLTNAVNGVNTKELVMDSWPHGKKFSFVPLYEDGDYNALAGYIAKSRGEKGETSFSHSRNNLVIPKPKYKKMRRKRWPEDPEPIKGWYIVKDSIYNGINPVTGYPYQHYSMRRLKPMQKPPPKQPAGKKALPDNSPVRIKPYGSRTKKNTSSSISGTG